MNPQATVPQSPAREAVTTRWLVTGLAVWFVLVVFASLTGLLARLSPCAIPPIALTLMALPAILFWRNSRVRAVVERIGLRRLTALHIFRILAVPLFFWYGAEGLLPKQFVDHAGWGDLISGMVALGVVALWPRHAGYWIAHLTGMVDFLVAFGTALMLTRTNPDSMAGVATLPAALIPFFFVGVLGSTHLIAYSLLLRGRSSETAAGWAAKAEVAR